MNDYRASRCLHDGLTLVRLPEGIDARGPHERAALDRAYAERAWRRRSDRPEPAVVIPRNVLRFGGAAKA